MEDVITDFRSRVAENIDLVPEGSNRFRVFTPFRFEDGDHFGIVLKLEEGRWILTDEAHTLTHLSYWMDDEALDSGNRSQVVAGALSAYSVQNRNGELIIPVLNNGFGNALFDFLQVLGKVSDVSFLSRERVRSTFEEDLRAVLVSATPENLIEFNWSDPVRDPKQHYVVDYRIGRGGRPLFVFGIPGEGKVKDAIISLLRFEGWGMQFDSMAVFEEQESIGRKMLARFTDVCGKTFSNLTENEGRIRNYIQRSIEAP